MTLVTASAVGLLLLALLLLGSAATVTRANNSTVMTQISVAAGEGAPRFRSHSTLSSGMKDEFNVVQYNVLAEVRLHTSCDVDIRASHRATQSSVLLEPERLL